MQYSYSLSHEVHVKGQYLSDNPHQEPSIEVELLASMIIRRISIAFAELRRTEDD